MHRLTLLGAQIIKALPSYKHLSFDDGNHKVDGVVKGIEIEKVLLQNMIIKMIINNIICTRLFTRTSNVNRGWLFFQVTQVKATIVSKSWWKCI